MKKHFFIAFFLLFFSAFLGAETVLQEIIVGDGDTLWGVANRYLKDPQSWPQLLQYNKLPTSDPNVILPGMRLKVPILLVKEQYRSAKLIRLLNRVFYRKKDQTSWERAQQDMMLFSDDGLRTMSQSIASVRFYSGETIKLEENSLVILRPEQKIDEVELLSGAVRASKSKVISADTEVTPKITPKGENPDYKTRIKPDKTTLVEVYTGIVDVTAQGKTVTLTKGFGTEVKYLNEPSEPFKLPPQIELGSDEPARVEGSYKVPVIPEMEGLTARDRRRRPQTEESARVIGNIIDKYRIQIARDKNFDNIVFDRTNDIGRGDIDFNKLNLPDGKYFFHVAYIDELGLQGPFSNPNFIVIDTVPPEIIIDYPEEKGVVDKELLILYGRTEPESMLTINDEIASINTDGSFSHTISAKTGRNTVKVEAVDQAGNKNSLIRTFTRLDKSSIKPEEKQPDYEKPRKTGLTAGSVALGALSISVIVGVVLLLLM